MIGVCFARVGRGGSIMNALYKSVVVATVLSAIGFIPVTMAFDEGHFSFGELYGAALVGLVHHLPPRRDHRVLHGHALGPGEVDLEARRRPGTRRTSSRASRSACRRRPRRCIVIAIGIVVAYEITDDALRHRRRRHGAAVDDRPDRRARRVRPGDRQRRRHRRDGRPGRVRPRHHRPARRRRQHDQGRHEGLRDRLRRPRRARPLRRVRARAQRGADHRPCSPSPTRG